MVFRFPGALCYFAPGICTALPQSVASYDSGPTTMICTIVYAPLVCILVYA